jgi:excisionase family DNA binding protein
MKAIRTVDANPITVASTIDPAIIGALELRLEQRLLDWLRANVVSPWMNTDKAAKYLDWPKKRLYNLVSTGEVPHRKHGNRLLFQRDELDRWLDRYVEGPVSVAAGPEASKDLQ